ncbi:hypothetical protein ACJX0J_016427, partial [Zea mays]
AETRNVNTFAMFYIVEICGNQTIFFLIIHIVASTLAQERPELTILTKIFHVKHIINKLLTKTQNIGNAPNKHLD